ncbi:hypothetical protein [Sphingomonas sp. LaA6.9]|uniref:hypothetical protein n=1 Tax=Sphingomonas sp. LaA6.9 TaxID=2919914 RepID=UPI001F4F9169|nr:hypothetical protein [Sphingomonas sp. LaA6.9]MCJ8159623.1 hypothetical protein [Sphingomonas sp. LaA6.9]
MGLKTTGWALALAGATLLAACDQSPRQPENGFTTSAEADPAAHFRTMPEKELLQLAFRTAFKDGATTLTLGDTRYAFRPEGISWVGGRAVLISGGQGEDCHGCAGTLAVHYLEPRGDTLQLVGAWPQTATGTSFGQPPEWTLRTDLASNPVLETQGGGTFQGYTCNAAELVELRPDAPVTVAEGVQLDYSDAGAVAGGRAQNIRGKIIPGTKDQSFVVAYNGSSTARVTYQRHGQTYEKAEGSTELPAC